MESYNDIILKYNNFDIPMQLPSTYKEFVNLLEKNLYLTPKILDSAIIYYYDSENDKNTLSEEEYSQCLTDNNGTFELEIELSQNKTNEGNNNMEDIVKKCGKIFKEKIKQKESEHKNEISEMKKEFEKTINSIIDESKIQYNSLCEYYNEKMKENFEEYNKMIIENIDKGISQSNLNKLTEEFINKNKFSNLGDDKENKENEGSGNLEFSIIK